MMMMVLLMVGCSNDAPVDEANKIIRNVDVIKVNEDNYRDYETYIGHVVGSGIIKRSFEVQGKLESISVEVGDVVSAGAPLMAVNKEGLQYALDVAIAESNASKAQYSKALEALEYTKNLYNRTKQLLQEGISSQYEFDQVSLNYKISEDDVVSAREVKSQAATNVLAKEYMIEHSEIFALQDGIVLDVLVEVGELTNAGYPVVILRDTFAQITFGISQKDIQFIEVNQDVEVTIDETTVICQVNYINQIPDQTTQTYEVTLDIAYDELVIGQIVKVAIPTTEVVGTKIPLGAIRSDGTDYVFLVVDGKAERVNITVIEIFNQEVVVEGLPSEATLIVEGIMNLVSGDAVKVVDE